MEGNEAAVFDDNDMADLFEDQDTDNLEEMETSLEDNDILDKGQPENDTEGTDDIDDTDDGEDDEDEGASDDDAEPDKEDNVLVKLDSGEEVSLSDLKSGYLKDKDYRHKTTELAEERKAIAAVQQSFSERSQFVESTLSNLVTYLESLVPPEPPITLAQSDPGNYQYQKALRDNAISELGQIMQMQEGHGQAQQGYSQEDLDRLKKDEDAKLLKAMPQLSDPAKRASFDAGIKETGIQFGFTEQEISGVADHRISQLVHYARLGKQAETNRANAKRRVTAPKKAKARPAKVTAKNQRNHKAKERLLKTGSLEDALRIDFE